MRVKVAVGRGHRRHLVLLGLLPRLACRHQQQRQGSKKGGR
jgi:hypothetical protein